MSNVFSVSSENCRRIQVQISRRNRSTFVQIHLDALVDKDSLGQLVWMAFHCQGTYWDGVLDRLMPNERHGLRAVGIWRRPVSWADSFACGISVQATQHYFTHRSLSLMLVIIWYDCCLYDSQTGASKLARKSVFRLRDITLNSGSLLGEVRSIDTKSWFNFGLKFEQHWWPLFPSSRRRQRVLSVALTGPLKSEKHLHKSEWGWDFLFSKWC